MKRYITYLLLCTVALLTACNVADVVDIPTAEGRLLLNFSSSEGQTRTGDHDVFENLVQHIDVFIFESGGSKLHYERIEVDASSGTIALQGKSHNDLKSKTINIYAVANSTKTTDDLDDITTVDALKTTVEVTPLVHLTGSGLTDGDGTGSAPEAFLMWGEGKVGENKDIPIDAAPEGDKTITLPLVRAVAKVEIHFLRNKGTGVEETGANIHGFGTPTGLTDNENITLADISYTADGSYYLNNMPYKSSFANFNYTESENRHLRKTSPLYNAGHFHWESKNDVKIVAYVYSYSWETDESEFEHAPRMVVNLPAVAYNDDRETGTYLEDNYYEITLRLPKFHAEGDNLSLKRNYHYTIKATINMPGSKSPMEPVEIQTLYYDEHPWKEVDIEVGGSTNEAAYLSLSTDRIEMRNTTIDSSTLRFASSSPVSIDLISATYINKFGQTLTTTTDMTTTYDTTAITGSVTIAGSMPTNDAACTVTFRVRNQEELTAEFSVVQYPSIHITNILGYYSYRSDWTSGTSGPSHYENRVSPYYSHSNWSDGEWDNGYGLTASNAFFRAKYTADTKTEGAYEGKSDINYYYWYRIFSMNFGTYNYKTAEEGGNARMYHVNINATSSEYIVGRPRLDANGYTEGGPDNAKLVSPSFMIASQLGATQAGEDLERAKQHCKYYVEVYKDEKGNSIHLDDWRLPTDAEIKFITESQYKTNAAMDEVLAGRYYHTASGTAFTRAENNDGVFTRCVRDHYVPTSNALSGE